MTALLRHVLVIATLMALTCAAPVLAQSPTPAQGGPSPSHLGLARELVNITGMSQIFDRITPQMTAQMKQNTVSRPELSKDLDQVMEALKPELDLQKQEMVTAAARIYAARLTEPELREIVGFFKTPSGAKYFQVTPTVIDEVATETQRWADRVSEYIMVRVRAEMGKRGFQLQ